MTKNIPYKDEKTFSLPLAVERERMLRVIREELTENQRIILSDYYFRELTMTEIANRMGINKSTVCRTLHRAEDKLRRYLKY